LRLRRGRLIDRGRRMGAACNHQNRKENNRQIPFHRSYLLSKVESRNAGRGTLDPPVLVIFSNSSTILFFTVLSAEADLFQ
jgi:hypothetical protein